MNKILEFCNDVSEWIMTDIYLTSDDPHSELHHAVGLISQACQGDDLDVLRQEARTLEMWDE